MFSQWGGDRGPSNIRMEKLEGRTALNVIDPTLKVGSTSAEDSIRCMHMGLLCVQENVANRPTMASVVLMLNSYSLSLPIPSRPAYFMRTTMEQGNLEVTDCV